MKSGNKLPPRVNPEWLLRQALYAARKRKPRPQDRAPGTGTNEGGPQVQTDYPANAWPEDGDHG